MALIDKLYICAYLSHDLLAQTKLIHNLQKIQITELTYTEPCTKEVENTFFSSKVKRREENYKDQSRNKRNRD